MADEEGLSTTKRRKSQKNVLIGVTGSVASIKLSKLVDELLLLQPKVPCHSQNQITNINVFCVAPMRCAISNDLFWLNHSICYFSPTIAELSDNFLFVERRKCIVYFNLRAGWTILFLRGWGWGVGNG